MSRMIRGLAIAAVFALAFVAGARAQNVFPTPAGSTANGAVAMCPSAASAALKVPCDTTNPLAVNIASGGGGAVTQGTIPWVDSITLWGGGTLGAMANYGTSPGAVLVPGVNAFVTNFPATYAVTGTFFQATQPVSNAGTFPVQAAITAASGSFASGSQAIGITPTDRTVTSATGSSQTVMSANATRKALTIVNTGNANCGVNPTGGTAVIGGAGTITLVPNGSYTPRVPTLAAVTAICTAAQPLYADEAG